MKLDSKKMAMVMAMAIGVLGATGCSNSKSSDDAIAPVENAASAPVEEAASSGTENFLRFSFSTGRTYYAPYGPPATRYETYGRAPSSRHFWAGGYHRWDGRQYTWIPGRWEVRRQNYNYVSPRWERHWGRWQYVPGRWVRY